MKSKSIGPAMRHFRERINLSPRKAAHRAGIAFSWWSELERQGGEGKAPPAPTAPVLFAIAKVLSVSVEELYNWSPPPAPPEPIAELKPQLQEIVRLLADETDDMLALVMEQVRLAKDMKRKPRNSRPQQAPLFPSPSLERVLPGL